MRTAAAALALALVAVAGAQAKVPAPALQRLRVGNGSTPFAGDGPLLTTVSPNGDGFRDAALVSFTLDRAATVRMDAVRTDTIRIGRPAEARVWTKTVSLAPGPHRLVWKPA